MTDPCRLNRLRCSPIIWRRVCAGPTTSKAIFLYFSGSNAKDMLFEFCYKVADRKKRLDDNFNYETISRKQQTVKYWMPVFLCMNSCCIEQVFDDYGKYDWIALNWGTHTHTDRHTKITKSKYLQIVDILKRHILSIYYQLTHAILVYPQPEVQLWNIETKKLKVEREREKDRNIEKQREK